jgi:hypothetical protein
MANNPRRCNTAIIKGAHRAQADDGFFRELKDFFWRAQVDFKKTDLRPTSFISATKINAVPLSNSIDDRKRRMRVKPVWATWRRENQALLNPSLQPAHASELELNFVAFLLE